MRFTAAVTCTFTTSIEKTRGTGVKPPLVKIGIVLDSPKRDLRGIALVAHELLKRGAEVYIMPMYQHGHDVPLLAPDAVLVNYARPNNAPLLQMFHALGLFAVAWSCSRRPGKLAPASGWLFVAGTLLFSGSLYALALTGERALGVVTPLGGLAFLAGWLCLAWSAIRA